MAYETLLVEQRNHVPYVTLNRLIALNALNTSLRRDLKQLFTDIQADPEARVVVITGVPAGPFAQERISKSGASHLGG
jgi:enoyl-CoA hydratase